MPIRHRLFTTLSLSVLGAVSTHFKAHAENMCQKYNMRHGVFSIKSDGSDLKLLRDLPGALNIDKMRVSPDGKKIVYLQCLEDVNADCICDGAEYFAKEVMVSDIDGQNPRIVGENQGGFNDYPGWMPDGNSVIFMLSTQKNKLNSDLIRFDLQSGKTVNLTRSENVFESDHHVNSQGKITVVQQQIEGFALHPVNNLFQFMLPHPEQRQQISFATESLGDHCCYADPRMSPDLKYLSFATYAKKKGKDGDWDIMLKNRHTQHLQDLSQNGAMDLWPAWNATATQVAWTSWDEDQHQYALRVYEVSKKTVKDIPLIGNNQRFTWQNKTLIFGRVHWFDWLNPSSDTLIFPATYALF